MMVGIAAATPKWPCCSQVPVTTCDTCELFIQKKIRKAFDGNVEVPKQIARLLCHAFCSLNSLSTLRESYGKSKAQFRSGAPSGPWVLSAPACAKIPL